MSEKIDPKFINKVKESLAGDPLRPFTFRLEKNKTEALFKKYEGKLTQTEIVTYALNRFSKEGE